MTKSIINFFIILAIEGYFLSKTSNSEFSSYEANMESFFFAWCLISLVLLIISIFNRKNGKNYIGGMGSIDKSNFIGNSMMTRMYSERTKINNRSGVFLLRRNMLYLLLLIINVICYIRFMP